MGLFDKLFGPPGRDNFAKLFMDGVHKAGERQRLTYDRGQSCIVGEGDQVAFLGNAYQEFCSAPKAQREQILHQRVAVTLNSSVAAVRPAASTVTTL